MNFHMLDIMSVGCIGFLAIFFLYNNYKKIKKNKCATICSGCSVGSCSTKSFVVDKKTIILKPIPNTRIDNA